MKIHSTLRALVIFSSLTVLSATAEQSSGPETPNDFAFGAELTVNDSLPFYRVTLPDSLYTDAAWPDLRDVRVFNSVGQALPFSLFYADEVRNETQTLPMTLFELTGEIRQENENRQGRVLSLETSDGLSATIPLYQDEQVKRSYLLKAPEHSEDNQYPDTLTLSWTKSDKNWRSRVSVYYSDTTKDWQPLVTDAPLMDLASGDERLLINTIDLGDRRRRASPYYLLVFKDGETGAMPPLNGVEAIYLSRNWKSETLQINFRGEQISQQEAEYRLPTPQPLKSLLILPAQDNVVLPLEVKYRSGDNHDWLPLPKQIAYQLINRDRDRAQSKPLELDDRLVKSVRITATNAPWGDNPPTVSGERRRMTLIFNAQGNQPYLLAWGAKNASSKAIPIETLIPDFMRSEEELRLMSRAAVNERFVLGGESRLTEPAPDKGSQWQIYLLWAILIVGVLGLGVFALKIWREVKQKSAREE